VVTSTAKMRFPSGSIWWFTQDIRRAPRQKKEVLYLIDSYSYIISLMWKSPIWGIFCQTTATGKTYGAKQLLFVE
jgi:hypothetical protein